MKFPNAARGVSKIYTSQVLTLLSAFLLGIASVLTLIVFLIQNPLSDINAVLVLAIGAISVAAVVLFIIAFVFNMIGIANASADEQSFKTAMIFLIAGIVLNVASTATSSAVPVLSGILGMLSTVTTLAVIILVIGGINKLADKRGKSEVSRKGASTLKIILAASVLMIIVRLVETILGGSGASLVSGIFALIAVVLEVVKDVVYLLFLKEGKNML